MGGFFSSTVHGEASPAGTPSRSSSRNDRLRDARAGAGEPASPSVATSKQPSDKDLRRDAMASSGSVTGAPYASYSRAASAKELTRDARWQTEPAPVKRAAKVRQASTRDAARDQFALQGREAKQRAARSGQGLRQKSSVRNTSSSSGCIEETY